MTWNWKFWQRKQRPDPNARETYPEFYDVIDPDRKYFPEDPFANSPFNADVITSDDPAWAIFEKAMETGGPVVGIYDGDTGEIVSIEAVDSWQARHDAIDDVQNHSLTTKPEEDQP